MKKRSHDILRDCSGVDDGDLQQIPIKPATGRVI